MMEGTPMVIRGKHVLLAMLAFFGTIIAVNLVFVYFALDTWTGISTENAYQKGLNYNQTIAARDAQRELGWQAEVSLTTLDDGREELTVVLRDRAGALLTNLAVNGTVKRPTHEGFDQQLALAEEASGRYSARLSLPLRGNWDLTLSAKSTRAAPEDQAFEMKTRLWLK